MKIVYSNGGELCNRLWCYSELIAHSIIKKEHIIIIDFYLYLQLFPNLNNHKYIHFIKSRKQQKFICLIVKILRKFHLLKKYKKLSKTNGLSYIDGWNHAGEFLYLHQAYDVLYNLFSPAKDVVKQCKTLFDKERLNSDIIIGIHIRRGDYKNFYNGIYFYENETYLKYILQLKHLFDNKCIKFFIASDDEIELTAFAGINCFQNQSNTGIVDLYSLSLCDYILGPPSTFSMWASFYGKVPLKVVKSQEECLSLEQFSVIKTLGVFSSGQIFTHD